MELSAENVLTCFVVASAFEANHENKMFGKMTTLFTVYGTIIINVSNAG